MIRSAGEIMGYTIRATDGDLGKVRDFYFDDLAWTVRYVVVDTGGWLSGRRVLVSPTAFEPPDWSLQMAPVNLSKRQIEQSPSVDEDKPVSRQLEVRLAEYYGWPTYWASAVFPVPVLAAATAVAEPPRQTGDPHLRSVKDVTGYRIQATDGAIGHVEDFLLDDSMWVIRYLVVDTRNWLPGRKVLLTPNMIATVRWNDATVGVDLSRQQVKDSPAYDSAAPVNREYESQYFDYYGRPAYWQ